VKSLKVEISDGGFVYFHPQVFVTAKGVRYLKQPGLVLVSKPSFSVHHLQGYLAGLNEEFCDYLEDDWLKLRAGEALIKFAGQCCYASFGKNRTRNQEINKYLTNLKSSKHGSVFEHANYSFLIYGVSRSLTHEFIRHRAGFAYSQLSQRYVDQSVLRFVERPEFQGDQHLHKAFEERINTTYQQYLELREALMEREKEVLGSSSSKTVARKKLNQAARAVLTNETETVLVVTANVRAWRHFIETRADPHAEPEIRILAFLLFQALHAIEPNLFGDYEVIESSDGFPYVTTSYQKI